MSHALRSPRLQPAERKAMVQEMLHQQHQFRQNMSLHHGLPEPAPPVSVDEPKPVPKPVVAVVEAVTAVVAPPKTSTTIDKLKKAAMVAALLGGGVAMPFIGEAIWGGDATPVIPAVADVPGDIVSELRTRGFDIPPTDLGEEIQQAFEYDPTLRSQLIENVKRTLEKHDAGTSGDTD